MNLYTKVRYLIESTKKDTIVCPKDSSATKMRNHIIKHFGAQPIKSYISNPYADYQVLEAKLPSENAEKLKVHLRKNGYTPTKFSNNAMSHENGNTISFHKIKDKDLHFLRIYGNKKAKRNDLPYYD